VKYSSDYSEYTGNVSKDLKALVDEIKDYFVLTNVSLLIFDEFRVAIPVEINVDLPTRGAVDIDIRAKEPILIVVSVNHGKYLCPSILSDRKDFPRNLLSHLFVVKEKTKPNPLCLTRNDRNEWYANSKISDVLDVVKEWYFKAGAGLLNTDGAEFDPTRLESYMGTHVYHYDRLYEIVRNGESVLPGVNFSMLFGSIGYVDEDSFVIKSFANIPFIGLKQIRDLFKIKSNEVAIRPNFTILCWNKENTIESRYSVSLPNNYEELIEFANGNGVELETIVDFYLKNELKNSKFVPVILGIKRPMKMIGYDGDFEFFNFIINANLHKGKINKASLVWSTMHIEPFSTELAEKVSGRTIKSYFAFLGAGSLGSKIIFHQARNGCKHLKIFDSDMMLKHNLVRHSLFSNKIGKNKALAIADEVKSFYETDQTRDIQGFDKNITYITERDLKDCNLIIDSTASLNVQNWLSNTDEITNEKVVRVEIAHQGNLGLLYREGEQRNPRVDDLVNFTYYLAMKNKFIENWRKYDMEHEPNNLSIGLGCSSTTSVLADEEISYHASQFSKLISNIEGIADTQGLIFLSMSNPKYPYFNENSVIEVQKFDIIKCMNESEWELRFSSGLCESLVLKSKENRNLETGGILVGMANHKTKTIHVLDIIDAPPDSIQEPCSFYRGIENLPEQIEEIKKKTGNMVGYIGEWHSHPMGLDILSKQDVENVNKLKEINELEQIPTCSVIVSNEKVLPFIFF
jgi:integrative and conjugative element protein (TIGR02256 family)